MVCTGRIFTLSGTDKAFRQGPIATAAYNVARSVCVDPHSANGYWVSDNVSVRYCDGGARGRSRKGGFRDGAKNDAQFNEVMGLVYRPQTKQLIAMR